jgi:hypothetical protein
LSGDRDFEFDPLKDGTKPFDVKKLIDVIAEGISRWGQSYNEEPDKFGKFIERYDKVVSDSRMTHFHVSALAP